jgi:ubiquinone biosynthesis protein COQ9
MLLGVYKSTELAMIQDKSQDYQDSWTFLDRRFEDIKDLSGILKGGPEDITKIIGGAGTTLKAILGLPR